jgi:hypothetical protein
MIFHPLTEQNSYPISRLAHDKSKLRVPRCISCWGVPVFPWSKRFDFNITYIHLETVMGDKELVHSAAAIMAAPMTAPKGSDAAKNGDRLL